MKIFLRLVPTAVHTNKSQWKPLFKDFCGMIEPFHILRHPLSIEKRDPTAKAAHVICCGLKGE